MFSTAFNFDAGTTFFFGSTFLVFVGSGNDLSAEQVFTTLALINVVRKNGVSYLTRCFFLLYEASVATSRIQVCCHQKYDFYKNYSPLFVFRNFFYLKN